MILEVVLHEGRHATQFYLINYFRNKTYFKELTFFDNFEQIKDNYLDYIENSSRHSNLYDYLNQPVEIDAQYHAIIALIEYEEVFKPKVEDELNDWINYIFYRSKFNLFPNSISTVAGMNCIMPD